MILKLTLSTALLQDLTNKAIKGASQNKMIPLTSLLEIELKERRLTLTTTDATNTLKVFANGVEGKDFRVVVPVDMFHKLISKTTVEFITLILKKNSLEVLGNGRYQLDLLLDEDGSLVKFPEYAFKVEEGVAPTIIEASTVRSILASNKASLAQTMENPSLTGYYFGEQVITSDRFKACGKKVNIFGSPTLLPPELVELLVLGGDGEIRVYRDGEQFLFESGNVVVHGWAMDCIDEFPVDAISDYLNQPFPSMCKINRKDFMQALDRLALFVSPYDRNGVFLTFTDKGLQLSSKQKNSDELLAYKESENFKDFVCYVDILMLIDQISSQDGEDVELWYGHETALKMIAGDVTQIVALLLNEAN
jgi:DNA polymerase III sliding clamp (beta) subunit (PCNA family)